MILVTGGTGTAGTEIVKELSRLGKPTRVLVRNRSAKIDLPSIEQMVGDLSRPETIAPALDGVESALLLTPPGEHAGKLQENFINAAKKAKLAHLVKFSAYGTALDSPCRLLRQHAESEKKVHDAGIPCTSLRPSEFMQNFLMMKDSIMAQGAIFAPLGQAKVNIVDVRDVAAVAARVLSEPGHAGKTYDITGPEAIGNQRIAEALSGALKRPVRYEDIPPDAFRRALLQMGVPEWQADGVNELYAIWRNNGATAITNVVETVGKKTPYTIAQFVSDYAPAFLGRAAARG